MEAGTGYTGGVPNVVEPRCGYVDLSVSSWEYTGNVSGPVSYSASVLPPIVQVRQVLSS